MDLSNLFSVGEHRQKWEEVLASSIRQGEHYMPLCLLSWAQEEAAAITAPASNSSGRGVLALRELQPRCLWGERELVWVATEGKAGAGNEEDLQPLSFKDQMYCL